MVIKKITGAGALALAVMLAAGCASGPKGSAKDTAAYKQNEEAGRPQWAGGISFTTEDNEDGYYWGGPIKKAGYFQSGSSDFANEEIATDTATLAAKADIAAYIRDSVGRRIDNEYGAVSASAGNGGDAQAVQNIRAALAEIEISRARRVDRFVEKNGKVHVLVFVPEEEIEKAIDAATKGQFKGVLERIFGTQN